MAVFFCPYPGTRLMQSKCLWTSAGMAIAMLLVLQQKQLLPMPQEEILLSWTFSLFQYIPFVH